MKTFIPLLALLVGLVPALAEPLSEGDRQVLLKRLDQLRGKAGEHVSKRLRGAAGEFSSAMQSDDAAVDLYLKCVEKVNFEDRDRRSSDFREWRRSNKDRLRSDGFALALRHQLRWAILTIKAANDPEKIYELAPEALLALEMIYNNPVELKDHIGTLCQPVTSTVFARAYGLNGYEAEGWPLSPLQGGNQNARSVTPFTGLILPAYRSAGDSEKLRDAWQRRILFEELACGFWSKDSTEEGESLEREEFLAKKRPALRWQMQEDLFRMGAEQKAALAMLNLLAENITNQQAREWEARFRELIDPVEPMSIEAPSPIEP